MIDLEAYLRRIGYDGPRTPTLATLRGVCAHHPAHIPYDNISPLLGQVPSLRPDDVEHKLITQQRGGYCFEQNLLLKLALQALGFDVQARAARVVWMRAADAAPRPGTHMLLKVTLDDRGATGDYLVDAGFGGNLMDMPLALGHTTPQRSAHALLRVTHDGDTCTTETRLPDGWAPMYRVMPQAFDDVDFEPLNWYTATHPASVFRHNLLVERVPPTQRRTLLNDRLLLRTPGSPPHVQRLMSADALGDTLHTHFGLALSPDEVQALWARVPLGLDQFVRPDA